MTTDPKELGPEPARPDPYTSSIAELGLYWLEQCDWHRRRADLAEARALKAEADAKRYRDRLMCRGENEAHYCAHCDNSLWLDDIHGDAALAAGKEEV